MKRRLFVAGLLIFIGAVTTLTPVLVAARTAPEAFDTAAPAVPGMVNALAEGGGSVWAATPKGLRRFDGRVWTTLTRMHGLPDDFVTTVAVAADGTVWAGTLQGAAKLPPSSLRFETVDAAGKDDIAALAVAADGTAWLGTASGLIKIEPPATGTDGPTTEGSPLQIDQNASAGATTEGSPLRLDHNASAGATKEGSSLRVDHDASAGATTEGSPLAVEHAAAAGGTRAQVFRQSNSGLPDDDVTAVAVAQDGGVWVGTGTHGVARLDAQRWTTFTRRDGLAGDAVDALAIGADGRVWAGTEDGLSAFDGRSWKSASTADGLPDRRVRALALGPDGTAWAGTPRGAWPFRWTAETTRPSRVAEGDGGIGFEGYVTSIAAGASGVWIGGWQGVTRLGGQPAVGSAPLPVVFVHGWHGPVKDEDSQLKFLRRWLERDGFQVFYATGIDSNLTLDQNAVNLRDFIRQVKLRTGAQKVHLIGHSMGGLNIRAYVESALYAGDVASVTTLGSPHAGVFLWRDYLAREIAQGSGEPSARELLPEHVALFNATHARPAGVPYYLIAGDITQQPELESLNFWPANDGIVDAHSALGLGTWPDQAPGITRILTSSIHGWSPGGLLLGLTSYLWPDDLYRGVLRNAYLVGEAGPRGVVQSPLPIPQAGTGTWVDGPPAPLNRTPAAFGNLAPGQVVSHTFTVDSVPTARFTFIWQSGPAKVRLVDPTGRRVDASSRTDTDNVQQFRFDADTFANLVVYSVRNPRPGSWTLAADGSDLKASADYAAYVEMDSPLRVSASLDAESYRPGQAMRIRASVRDGERAVTGAVVSGKWSVVRGQGPEAEGDGAEVRLFDDGQHGDGAADDGVYASALPAPVEGGYIPVMVTARGARAGAGHGPGEVTFEREVTAFAVVSPGTGRLTGAYTDRLEDTDGDGRPERLMIDVGVEARQAGDFEVAVRLERDGREVARSLLPVQLAAGRQTVSVPFAARDLLARGVDGPYDVAEVRLMDASGAAVAEDRAERAHRTAAYAVRELEEGK